MEKTLKIMETETDSGDVPETVREAIRVADGASSRDEWYQRFLSS